MQALKKIKPTIIATFIKLIGLAAVFIPVAVFLGFRNQELVAALIMLDNTVVKTIMLDDNTSSLSILFAIT